MLLDAIKKYIPQIEYSEAPSEGYAAGAACRRYGAFSLSVDGYVYRWSSDRVPELSSFYEDCCQIWNLRDIKAAGDLFISALTDFKWPSGQR